MNIGADKRYDYALIKVLDYSIFCVDSGTIRMICQNGIPALPPLNEIELSRHNTSLNS